MKITARYRFAASHRLNLAHLSAEENRRLFDKCNNPYGHGHDYQLEVTLEGPVEADGQIVNRMELDRVVHERVIAKLDHRNLNCDVPDFAGTNPTTENLAELIGRWLLTDWKLSPRLARLGIIETPKNVFVWEAPR